jgi:hypothetical protein
MLAWMALLITTAARPATAEPITWQFTGTIGAVQAYGGYSDGDLASVFGTGSSVIYTLTYDLAAPVSSSSEFRSQYTFGEADGTFSYTATVAGHDFGWTGQGLVFLNLYNSLTFSVDTSLSEITMGGSVTGDDATWYAKAFDIEVQNAGGPELLLPYAIPGAGAFTFYLQADRPSCWGCGVEGVVTGTLAPVDRVPSPPALLLVLLGSAGFLLRRKS